MHGGHDALQLVDDGGVAVQHPHSRVPRALHCPRVNAHPHTHPLEDTVIFVGREAALQGGRLSEEAAPQDAGSAAGPHLQGGLQPELQSSRHDSSLAAASGTSLTFCGQPESSGHTQLTWLMWAGTGSHKTNDTSALPAMQQAMRNQAWLLPMKAACDEVTQPCSTTSPSENEHQLTSLRSGSPGASRDCCSHTTVFFPGVLGVSSISRLFLESPRKVAARLVAAAVDTLSRVDSVRVRVFLCIWSCTGHCALTRACRHGHAVGCFTESACQGVWDQHTMSGGHGRSAA